MLRFKEYVETDEALSVAQRRKKSVQMRKNKAKLNIGRKRQANKIADKKRLEKRAMRQTRNAFAKKFAKAAKADLTPARKSEIEKRLDKPAMKARIKKIAMRKVKDVRKAELKRKRGRK